MARRQRRGRTRPRLPNSKNRYRRFASERLAARLHPELFRASRLVAATIP